MKLDPFNNILDSSGAIYICGYAFSDGLPTKNAIQSTYGGGQTDALLAKLTPAGDSIVYATYFGREAATMLRSLLV